MTLETLLRFAPRLSAYRIDPDRMLSDALRLLDAMHLDEVTTATYMQQIEAVWQEVACLRERCNGDAAPKQY